MLNVIKKYTDIYRACRLHILYNYYNINASRTLQRYNG